MALINTIYVFALHTHFIKKVFFCVSTFTFIKKEIVDEDFTFGYVCKFHYAVKSNAYFFHVSFLETCKSYGL